ncbi:hypothetical protein QEJ31_08805 [Pigmentibacter sp. JX0631]|uniref:hypothetical protein n=1 Tax=Pigmentibacter sp. JX0631 TaxID=2976982 RepID=UPI002469454A|nr:hypothetical protein [Pigmentibacter sp. JX0631]WGL58633.1 hypothetical protein QEJ31_08805 [Pigmentibacter sp. JX0631]
MKKIFLVFSAIFITQYAQAKDFNVYCSNNQGDWKWLHEPGNILKIEKISGEISEKRITKEIVHFYASYLKIDQDIEYVKVLQQKCMNQHGSDYRYPQASKSLTSQGYLLGLSDQEIFPGLYTIYTDIAGLYDSVDSYKVFNPTMSNIDQLFRK